MDDPTKPKAHLLDDLIAACVAHGLTDEATAEMVGTSPRTVRRRRQDPGVTDKVSELVIKRAEEVHVRLSGLGTSAIDLFQEVMANPDIFVSHRISAANVVMKNLHVFRSTAELEQRVAELEGLLERLRPLLEAEDDQ